MSDRMLNERDRELSEEAARMIDSEMYFQELETFEFDDEDLDLLYADEFGDH